MLINIRSLQRIPIYSADNSEYRIVDAFLNTSGTALEGFALKRLPFYLDEEFLISKDNIGETHIEALSQAIHLKQDNQSIEKYICGDCHARSINKLLTFKVHCSDEKLGLVKDIFIHPLSLDIHYLAVQVSRGCMKSWAFLDPQKFERLDWVNKAGYINLSRADILSGPLYRPRALLTEKLQDLFRSPKNPTDIGPLLS